MGYTWKYWLVPIPSHLQNYENPGGDYYSEGGASVELHRQARIQTTTLPEANQNLKTMLNTWRIIPVSKCLITMVSKFPKWGCSPYKWPFMAYRWGLLTT